MSMLCLPAVWIFSVRCSNLVISMSETCSSPLVLVHFPFLYSLPHSIWAKVVLATVSWSLDLLCTILYHRLVYRSHRQVYRSHRQVSDTIRIYYFSCWRYSAIWRRAGLVKNIFVPCCIFCYLVGAGLTDGCALLKLSWLSSDWWTLIYYCRCIIIVCYDRMRPYYILTHV